MTAAVKNNKIPSPSGRVRVGFYSELTRDEAFGLILDHREPLKRRVYYWLLIHGPATRWEAAINMNLELSSVCARINELMHDGVVHEISGEKGIKFNSRTQKNNRLLKAISGKRQGELF